jgi:hypothetical protein
MAARGARSRKVVEKEITKESAKKSEDRFMPRTFTKKPDSSRVMSPVAAWGRKSSHPSGMSIHSGDSAGSSGRISVAGSKLSSTLASVSLTDEKYADKGKNTSAPRGRGGGVPVKLSEAKSDRSQYRSVKAKRTQSSMPFRPSSRATNITNLTNYGSGSGSGSEFYISGRSWERTKIWSGGLTQPKPYGGFENVRFDVQVRFKC